MPFEDVAFLFTSGWANRGIIRMDLDEAVALYTVAKSAQRVVEIGRKHGGSVLLMASAMESGKLISIDRIPPPDGLAAQVMSLAPCVAVSLIVGLAGEVPTLDNIDLLFIDGDHSYDGARADFTRWSPCVRVGGVVAFHDMAKTRTNATQVWELARLRKEILQNTTLAMIQEVGSMSFFRKLQPS